MDVKKKSNADIELKNINKLPAFLCDNYLYKPLCNNILQLENLQAKGVLYEINCPDCCTSIRSQGINVKRVYNNILKRCVNCGSEELIIRQVDVDKCKDFCISSDQNKISVDEMHECVSVLVPVFNVEGYLSKCIDSILMQDYPETEIIITDDGSNDRSASICDEYALKYSNVIVIHTENKGVSVARNLAIDVSSGKFISFVDSDDFIESSFVSKLVNLIRQSGADIAECGFNKIGKTESETKKSDCITRLLTREEWLLETGHGDYVTVVVWNKLYKRELFNSIRFPAGRVHEDLAFTYRVVYSAKKIIRTYEKLYNYVTRPESICNIRIVRKNIEDTYIAANEECEFFKSKDRRLYNFYSAKKCILLISLMHVIPQFYSQNEIREFNAEIVNSFKDLKKTPIKYRITILFYIISPSFIRQRISVLLDEKIFKMSNVY